ncbi:MAG: CBS and ACT domain-containing protein [Syntrophobacterales bacterium]|jgi:acetoin utilization protein AcuB|nr:CBS and ACT domain-containing protein [Syntrophobacterales bacterium]
MPVQEWMSKDLITIDEDTSIMKASKVMKQNNIQHLPVMKKGRLVGMVSDRDLKEATPSKATTLDIHEMYYLLDKIEVKSLMSKTLITIAPENTVEKAAAVMLKHHISALAVVDANGALAGIITKGDIFRAFVSISGIYQGALAMGVELPDEAGYIKQVTDVIRAHGGRIASVMTRYEGAPEGFKHVYIRAKHIKDEKDLRKDLESKHKILYFFNEKVD